MEDLNDNLTPTLPLCDSSYGDEVRSAKIMSEKKEGQIAMTGIGRLVVTKI